jgi:hypothetical protein
MIKDIVVNLPVGASRDAATRFVRPSWLSFPKIPSGLGFTW